MKELIRKEDWLKELVNDYDINSWNSEVKECCTVDQFRLHFNGTPRSPWNFSAARVFTDHFLRTHPEIYPDVWAVRRMVLKKTQAHIKSLIRSFHDKDRGDNVKLAAKREKNRRERKTNVSPPK
jgi:hypothetical protein